MATKKKTPAPAAAAAEAPAAAPEAGRSSYQFRVADMPDAVQKALRKAHGPNLHTVHVRADGLAAARVGLKEEVARILLSGAQRVQFDVPDFPDIKPEHVAKV